MVQYQSQFEVEKTCFHSLNNITGQKLLWAGLESVAFVAARALATYLIPGCVRRGVRLGSENSSGGGGAGGVWKSGNLVTWKSGNLEVWGRGNLGIWRSGDLEIKKIGVQIIKKK